MRGLVQSGEVSRAGELTKIRLRKGVSPVAAKRIAGLVSNATRGITKTKQKGNKKWKPCLDVADGGFLGGSSSFHSGLWERGMNSKLCMCKRCKPDPKPKPQQAQEYAA